MPGMLPEALSQTEAHHSERVGSARSGQPSDSRTQTGMLSHGEANIPFRLLTLAHQGLMGECDTPLPVGARVGVCIGGDTSVAAVLCWVRGNRFGARLGSPLNYGKLGGTRRVAMHRNPRPPRFSINVRVTARYGMIVAPARVRNISSYGCMIEAALMLRIGQAVEIELPALPPLLGRVRWSRMGRAGLMLDTPLSEDQLRHLLPQASTRQALMYNA